MNKIVVTDSKTLVRKPYTQALVPAEDITIQGAQGTRRPATLDIIEAALALEGYEILARTEEPYTLTVVRHG